MAVWLGGCLQIEELRRPFVSVYGMGMQEDIDMDKTGLFIDVQIARWIITPTQCL